MKERVWEEWSVGCVGMGDEGAGVGGVERREEGAREE